MAEHLTRVTDEWLAELLRLAYPSRIHHLTWSKLEDGTERCDINWLEMRGLASIALGITEPDHLDLVPVSALQSLALSANRYMRGEFPLPLEPTPKPAEVEANVRSEPDSEIGNVALRQRARARGGGIVRGRARPPDVLSDPSARVEGGSDDGEKA